MKFPEGKPLFCGEIATPPSDNRLSPLVRGVLSSSKLPQSSSANPTVYIGEFEDYDRFIRGFLPALDYDSRNLLAHAFSGDGSAVHSY